MAPEPCDLALLDTTDHRETWGNQSALCQPHLLVLRLASSWLLVDPFLLSTRQKGNVSITFAPSGKEHLSWERLKMADPLSVCNQGKPKGTRFRGPMPESYPQWRWSSRTSAQRSPFTPRSEDDDRSPRPMANKGLLGYSKTHVFRLRVFFPTP